MYPQSQLREICQNLKIPNFDLTDTIYVAGGCELYRDYIHLNAAGNDEIVDAIEEFLLEQL